jgi:hypothetical protein
MVVWFPHSLFVFICVFSRDGLYCDSAKGCPSVSRHLHSEAFVGFLVDDLAWVSGGRRAILLSAGAYEQLFAGG